MGKWYDGKEHDIHKILRGFFGFENVHFDNYHTYNILVDSVDDTQFKMLAIYCTEHSLSVRMGPHDDKGFVIEVTK